MASASAAATPAPDTIAEAVKRYEAHGFVAPFVVRAAGQVQCMACKTVLPPERVRMLAMHRLEGASDPDDEVAVVAIECGQCSKRGTLALSFGPAASAEDKIAFAGMDDRRGGKGTDLPQGM